MKIHAEAIHDTGGRVEPVHPIIEVPALVLIRRPEYGAAVLRYVIMGLWLLALAPQKTKAGGETPPLFDDFYNVSIGQYQVLSQAGRALGNNTSWFMNQMLLQYSKFFANWQPKERARVIVFSNLADFRQYAATTTRQTHTTLAGFCHLATDTDGNRFFELVTYNHDNLWAVLAHEGFHQFIYYELGPNVPIWFNEGFAQYFETSYILQSKLHVGAINKPMLQHVQNLLRAQKLVSIANLIQMDQPTFYQDPQRTYPTGWALVHFLLHREGNTYRDSDVRKYVADLKLRKDPVTSFYNRFGRDRPALQQEFERYLAGLKAR